MSGQNYGNGGRGGYNNGNSAYNNNNDNVGIGGSYEASNNYDSRYVSNSNGGGPPAIFLTIASRPNNENNNYRASSSNNYGTSSSSSNSNNYDRDQDNLRPLYNHNNVNNNNNNNWTPTSTYTANVAPLREYSHSIRNDEREYSRDNEPFGRTYATNEVKQDSSQYNNRNNEPTLYDNHHRPGDDYEPVVGENSSRNNVRSGYVNHDSYSTKGNVPEYRIAIIAADTSGDKSTSESKVLESKLLPIEGTGKAIPVGSVTITTRK